MVEELVFNVGGRLGKLRGELGLSLRPLRARTEVSPSTIQKIENNQVSPTLGTILRIGRGLGKDIHFFLDQSHEPKNVAVCRKEERRRPHPSDLPLTLELLGEGLDDQRVSPVILTLPPGGNEAPISATRARNSGTAWRAGWSLPSGGGSTCSPKGTPSTSRAVSGTVG